MENTLNRYGAWAVLLAGGDGNRLQSLTSRIEGDARPKQFSRILGGETLLRQTRRRLDSLFDAGKMLAVVNQKHEPLYREELADMPESAILVQPENRGTGVAIAAVVAMLLKVDANASVAFFPCDHFYSNEPAFLRTVNACIQIVHRNPQAIVLVGAEPTYPESEYGWIEPVRSLTHDPAYTSSRVRRFWEKPARTTAYELLNRGCLWNTFVTLGRASVFREMLCMAAPGAMHLLNTADLSSSYRQIQSIDFSRDVLARQADRLLVVRDNASGWTDLGSPDRVFATLTQQRLAPAWLRSFPVGTEAKYAG